jgi:hypothetical protein
MLLDYFVDMVVVNLVGYCSRSVTMLLEHFIEVVSVSLVE